MGSMAALKINLADGLKGRLKARAKESGFDKVEQYIEAMVVADIAGPTVGEEEIEALLLFRVGSPTVEMDRADFEQMRRKLRARIDRGRGSKA